MSDYCECPWTGKLFDMAEQLSEARGQIAALTFERDLERGLRLEAEARIFTGHQANVAGAFWLSADESDRGGQWVVPVADIRRALTPGVSE